jgi:hypothetical protein
MGAVKATAASLNSAGRQQRHAVRAIVSNATKTQTMTSSPTSAAAPAKNSQHATVDSYSEARPTETSGQLLHLAANFERKREHARRALTDSSKTQMATSG